VIGDRPFPCDRIGTVAALAVGGIPGLLMIGIGGGVVIVPVAVHALGGGAEIDTIDMAIGTCGGLVFPFQGEARMIGYRPFPCDRIGTVAVLAVGGIPGLLVVGVGGGVVVVPVTVHAIGGGPGVDAVNMAIGTCGGLVLSF